jgi:superfamily II DNA or RNA helicase
MQKAVIRLQGPLLEISRDGQEVLPPEVVSLLAAPLVYTYREFLRGFDAYDSLTGARENIHYEHRRLYQYDADGRFCCQRGFLPRIIGILRENGYEPEIVNRNPPVAPEVYTADWDRVFERFTLRPGQDACLARIDMHDGGIIDAVPAFGKMYIIAMTCVMYPRAQIDIVTKRRDVVASTQRLLAKWIPSVGVVGGGQRRRGRVTIYTADSLHHSDYRANIVMADEVHELMTDRYAALLGRYWYARMYGLTATKETRFDNLYARMEALFGPTIFKMSYQQAEGNGLVVPIVVQWLDVCPDHDPAERFTDPVARKRHGVWRHTYRNQVIADAARGMVDAGMQTLILVETLEHALHLRRLLPDFVCCYSEQCIPADNERRKMLIDNGLLSENDVMTPARRDALRRGFEQREFLGAIATGVWSVGVSFNSLQVLVRADGGASETANLQNPGRVCRVDAASGKEAGIVIDLLDQFNPGFARNALGRRRCYAEHGWAQYLPSGKLWARRRHATV